MKKTILFITLILGLALSANSQTLLKTSEGTIQNPYWNITTNYTLTSTTPAYFQFNTTNYPYTAQEVVVNLDSASGNHTNVAVALYGRVSDQLSWTQIGSTVNWKGTTADTTLIISNATENKYLQFKLLFTGTGTGTTTIDRTEFKLYNGLP